ncbi:hypothetical protein KP509_36G057000 [Ceratopteris richardii]|uniref:DNA (cytosine-5-)-methyltransferase n=1 Tax=Ceratopteris richardii TaxID=49495 RepID=A0A8T2QC01_CERRI|nr:hypothetical protein KP509_36G057000 [Ceratopteris richardii]
MSMECCSLCVGDPEDVLKHYMCNMGYEYSKILLAIESCEIENCSGLPDCVCFQKSVCHLVDFIDSLVEPEGKNPASSSTPQHLNNDTKKNMLSDMGYTADEISHAVQICGDSCDIDILVDFMHAKSAYKEEMQVLNSRTPEAEIDDEEAASISQHISKAGKITMSYNNQMRQSSSESDGELDTWIGSTSSSSSWKSGKLKRKRIINGISSVDEDECTESNNSSQNISGMHGLRGGSMLQNRVISSAMRGPPYCYFENVALMPKNEWETITRFFNGLKPEFVDSAEFSACHRQRGYVHNLPIEGREVIYPRSPMTIQEAFPGKAKFRPYWDTRTKMNCINTVRSPSTVCKEIADTMSKYDNEPPLHVQKRILCLLKKFNLLWVNPGLVAPLEPVEMEILLGFDEEHTRGASSMTERYKALGNTFQVDTVAYHMTALRSLYHHGIKVLSLFSGIGGAEVALHRAGIPLKVVVAVEGNSRRNEVLESWWKRTGQTGRLVHISDVATLTHDVLFALVQEVNGFDLVIGGSPCNNLTGSNRVTRVGLEGEHSRLFFEFPRIYNLVKQLQAQ